MWYADDCTGCGSIVDLSRWWSTLLEFGPQFGYFPNASKSILLVKPAHFTKTKNLFQDISIVTDGACILGSPVGNGEFVTNWIMRKVCSWVDEISSLSIIAKSQPQSAFAQSAAISTSALVDLLFTQSDCLMFLCLRSVPSVPSEEIVLLPFVIILHLSMPISHLLS